MVIDELKNKLQSKVLKAGLVYVMGTVILKGIAFFSTPLFTHLMTTNDYGKYGVYLSYEAIMNIIIALGVQNSIRNAFIDYKSEIKAYVSSLLGIVSLVFIAMLFLNSTFIICGMDLLGFGFFYSNLLICHSFAAAIIEIALISYTVDYQSNKYLAVSLCCSVMNILVSIVLMLTVFTDNRFEARVLGLSGTYCMVAVCLYARKVYEGKSLFKLRYWSYALKIGIPMIVFYLGYSLLSSFDRIMITEICGEKEAGIYSFAYNIANILNIIVNAVFTAWVPWFYEKLEKQAYFDIQKRKDSLIRLMSVVACCFTLSAPEFVKFMAPSSYIEGRNFLGVLIGGMVLIFLYNFYGYTELYYKKTVYLTIGTWMATVINIGLNYVFICIYGYYAAAYTTLVSYFCLFIVHKIIVRCKFKHVCDKNSKCEWIMIVMYIISLLLSIKLMDFWYLRWGVIVLIALNGVFVFLKGEKDGLIGEN